MIPTKFPQSNINLVGPEGSDIQPPPAWTDGRYCLSRWRMTWRERLVALFTGQVWCWIMSGRTQPPMFLSLEDPQFEAKPQDISSVTAAMVKRLRKAIKKGAQAAAILAAVCYLGGCASDRAEFTLVRPERSLGGGKSEPALWAKKGDAGHVYMLELGGTNLVRMPK